jgi:hypothetical protein
MPRGWLATASKAFIFVVVLITASSPLLPLVRVVVVSDFIIRTA